MVAIVSAAAIGVWGGLSPARGAGEGAAAATQKQEGIPALIGKLTAPEESVAGEARQQLAQRGAEAVPALVAALGSGDNRTRDAVALVLASIGDPRAVKPLANLLNHADPNIAHAAAWALRRIGAPAADALGAALAGSAASARFPAAYALAGIAGVRNADPWLSALKDPDVRVRYYAATALGDIADARAVEALRKAAADKDPLVRRTATTALAKADAARRAAEGGTDKPEDAAAETARYQASIDAWNAGGEASVDLLIRGLQDTSPRIRRHCAWALGRLGSARGVEPLIRVVELPIDPQQVSYAVKSLAAITGQSFGPDAQAWRQWYDRQAPVKSK